MAEISTPHRRFGIRAGFAKIHELKRYERHISAGAMVAGFAFDNVTYGRIDHPGAQIVLGTFILLAALSILGLHYFETRNEGSDKPFRWRAAFSAVTQFALGGLWSAFLVFYSRSAVLETSWPFLLIMVGIFIGNEVFRAYHSRLVFTALLFFFALFSYATFVVPVFTKTIGRTTFLFSGALAVIGFLLFLFVLNRLAPGRFRPAFWKIAAGAIAVYAFLNSVYFMDILPPVPLALTDAGIYFSVKKEGAAYHAVGEPRSWWNRIGYSETYHLEGGKPLYLYSAVFAPVRLTTHIVHRWQHFEDNPKRWRTVSLVSFQIRGGRDNGYRTYSILTKPLDGRWRVVIETNDGRTIGQLKFAVVRATTPPVTVDKFLQ